MSPLTKRHVPSNKHVPQFVETAELASHRYHKDGKTVYLYALTDTDVLAWGKGWLSAYTVEKKENRVGKWIAMPVRGD